MKINIILSIISYLNDLKTGNEFVIYIILISIQLCLPVFALAPGTITTGELVVDEAGARIGWPITYTHTSGSIVLSSIYLYWPSSTSNLLDITLDNKQVYGVAKPPPFAAITSGLTSITADKSIYYNQPKTLWFNFQQALELVGDNAVETVVDTSVKGRAEAFYFIAAASGTANAFNLYIDSDNSASNILVGVYAGTSSAPTTLLTTGSLSNPTSGAWNAISINPISITSGSRYYLAVLNPNSGSGRLKLRVGSSGTSKTSSKTNLNALPTTRTTGSSQSKIISAYLTMPSSMNTNPADYRIRLNFSSGDYAGYPSFPTCSLSVQQSFAMHPHPGIMPAQQTKFPRSHMLMHGRWILLSKDLSNIMFFSFALFVSSATVYRPSKRQKYVTKIASGQNDRHRHSQG